MAERFIYVEGIKQGVNYLLSSVHKYVFLLFFLSTLYIKFHALKAVKENIKTYILAVSM